jgi:hypothetical protein
VIRSRASMDIIFGNFGLHWHASMDILVGLLVFMTVYIVGGLWIRQYERRGQNKGKFWFCHSKIKIKLASLTTRLPLSTRTVSTHSPSQLSCRKLTRLPTECSSRRRSRSSTRGCRPPTRRARVCVVFPICSHGGSIQHNSR